MKNAFGQMLTRIREFHDLVAAHPRGRVEKFWVGSPASEQDIQDAQPTFDDDNDQTNGEIDESASELPECLIELARIANGAELIWSYVRADGAKVKGQIELPSLLRLQNNVSMTWMDGEPGWNVAPTAATLECVMPCEVPGAVFLFDRDTEVVAEDLSLQTVYEAMLDALGLEGWDAGICDSDADVFASAKAILVELQEAVATRRSSAAVTDVTNETATKKTASTKKATAQKTAKKVEK